jgi:hypothetical protein
MFAEMPLDNWAVDAFPAFGRHWLFRPFSNDTASDAT